MRIASFNDGRVGFVKDDHVYEIPGFGGTRPGQLSAMRRLIEGWDTGGWSDGLPLLDPVPLADVTLMPPVPDPTKIFAAPVNYRDHQVEMNESVQVSGLGLFLKAPSSLVGHGDIVRLPYQDRRFDHEGEVAVVIGRQARNVSKADALGYVFGYTALLDMTMRGKEDRSTRKSFETFTPMGPWIVTLDRDDANDVENLAFTCRLNDEVRQDAVTSDLIWGIADLVAYASTITTLHPGDVITSGTPAGVGPVATGDSIDVEIQGIGGSLTVSVSDVGAVLCPTKA
ncbi:fumarylacetoacetate hydrolase family protein [Williamsia sp. 1138]|uniref:fumarylacetoacetate hydrolase family protein n=1 Tax=Williamsia sp. 1138 TaxID=1903117 RepID=UPI001FF0633F|nr:fumarylacetoacetate hydrolase family protein [Williamsia sp. 1138]